MTTSTSWRRCSVATAAILAALAAGCGSAQQNGTGAPVAVTERDFHISAPTQLPAGEVVLQAYNKGPDRHELLVARVGASGLPMRADGLTIDEEAIEKNEPGALEPGAPGSVRTLHLKLAAGRYVLFCNMAGHYMGGMHTDLVVR